MSGHSKFANIKHKKEKNDAKKGKIFTILGREIAVAVKSGGADPNANSKLREVIAKAKSNNMPNDNIERSIKKASGDVDGVTYETIVYEGYGPKGVAIIVETLTDNKNRSVANVRSAFTKGGGNMGTSGCVSFMFQEVGQIIIEKSNTIDSDELMLMVIDAGARDFNEEDEGYEIITETDDFYSVCNVLEENNIETMSKEICLLPETFTSLTDEDDIKKLNKLLSLLEDDDDVKNVYHNLEL